MEDLHSGAAILPAPESGLVDGAMKCDRRDSNPYKEKDEKKRTIISGTDQLLNGNSVCLILFIFSLSL